MSDYKKWLDRNNQSGSVPKGWKPDNPVPDSEPREFEKLWEQDRSVIKAAYERLRKENEELRAELHKWVNTSVGKELACLRVERDRYRQALEDCIKAQRKEGVYNCEILAIARKALEGSNDT